MRSNDPVMFLLGPLAFLLPLIFSLTVREFAHAQVATWLGDDTARRAGRLTLNPIPHADLVGTLIAPFLTILLSGAYPGGQGSLNFPIFAWAKPAPVDSAKLTRRLNRRRAAMWVALAGPLSNLTFALLCSLLLRFWLALALSREAPSATEAGAMVAMQLVQMNIGLCVFHLLPLYPLDGARIVLGALPSRLAHAYEQWLGRMGSWPLLLFVFVPGLRNVLIVPMRALLGLCLTVAGFGS